MKTRVVTFQPRLALLAIILVAATLRLWRLQSLPLGLWYDTAINGSDIRMMLSGAGWPVYFPANNGREPLFIYLQAISVAVLGATPYALRIVSALVGIVTIPAIFAVARHLWASETAPQDRATGLSAREVPWLALLAAAGLAVSYWHLTLSRRGLRTVMLPFASILALGLFWQAWTRQRYRDYAFSGVWFAIALYSYTGARLLPAVPLVFLFSEAMLDLWRARHGSYQNRQELWSTWRHRLAGLGLLVTVMGVLLLPLAISAWHQPGLLSTRTTQISILEGEGTPWPRLATNAVATVRSFYDRGDLNPRANLPGRPANDPLQAALFTLGLLVAFRHIRRPHYRLLLTWLGIMLLPTALSTDCPNFVRGSGALPPLVLLYAAGAMAALKMRPHALVRTCGPPVLLAALLLVSGGLTARDYFVRWPAIPDFGDAFLVRARTAPQITAETLARLLPTSTPQQPLLISYYQYLQPQTIFALGPLSPGAPPPALEHRELTTRVRFVLEDTFDPLQPLYLLWQENGRVKSAALAPLSVRDAETVQGLLRPHPGVTTVKAPGYKEDAPAVYRGWLPEGVQLRAQPITNLVNVRFEDGVRLVGYDVEPEPPAPGSGSREEAGLRLTLSWQLDERVSPVALGNARVFVHLIDARGLEQQDHGILAQNYLLGWLQPGADHGWQDVYLLPAHDLVPPGKAYLEAGLYRPAAGEDDDRHDRIPVTIDGQPAGDRVDMGAVMIGEPVPQAHIADLRPIRAQFGSQIELVGWRAEPDPAETGALRVDVGWRSLARTPVNYTAFVHLVDDRQQLVAQHDEPPGGGVNPTTRWVPGETVRTTFVLKLRPGIDLNTVALRVGLYEPLSGKRLPLTATQAGAPDGAAYNPTEAYVILPLTAH